MRWDHIDVLKLVTSALSFNPGDLFPHIKMIPPQILSRLSGIISTGPKTYENTNNIYKTNKLFSCTYTDGFGVSRFYSLSGKGCH